MLAAVSYFGGKAGSGVFQAIISLMPPHDVYVEPFLGGGAIMRMKRPATRNIGIDADAGVIAKARDEISRRGFERFRPTAPEPARGSRRSPQPAMEDSSVKTGDARSPRFDFLHGCGTSWLETAMADPHDRTLIYCDPPYLHSTRASRQRYAHEMTDVDHLRLLRVIRTLKCFVMISGYSSPLYARELKGWNATAFQAATRGAPAAEWVWYNFPPPVELHDYRYLGRDFRERERIRRQQRRWSTRLAKMPLIERRALLAAIREAFVD